MNKRDGTLTPLPDHRNQTAPDTRHLTDANSDRIPLPDRHVTASPDVHGAMSLHDVSLTRRGRCLIEGLTMHVDRGEVIGVTGPSGAGKTTLLRTLAGLDHRHEGTIETHGARIAMVFQEPRLLPWKTAEQNVALYLTKRNIRGCAAAATKTEATRQARQWLTRVGLADAADAHPAQLSGGMKQRVAIARALALEPEILIVDEPFSALDDSLTHELGTMLRQIIDERSVTTWWVSHDIDEVTRICDRRLEITNHDGAWHLSRTSLSRHHAATH